MDESDDLIRIARLRSLAKRQGFVIKKSRMMTRTLNNQGGYMITDLNNIIQAGEKFDLTLDDVEKFLEEN
jgi:hypothetical protein